jgi:outer membrane protein
VRKTNVSVAPTICLLVCLLCSATASSAQQKGGVLYYPPLKRSVPSPTKSQPPPRQQQPRPQEQLPQTQQPRALPRPTPQTQTDLPPQERRVERPSPYYAYPFGSRTTQERTLGVNEAVQLALQQASTFQQAQFDERIAREDVKQARSAFLPQLSLPLGYLGNTPSKIRAEDEATIASYVASSAIHESTGFFQVAGELDVSGRLRAALRRSRHLLDAARAGTQVSRRELVIATVDAYYGLVLARQRRRLADETLSLAEGFLKVAQGLEQRGGGEEADVLRARAGVAQRRDELEQARAAEAASMDLLRTLTGTDFSTYINVARIAQDVPTVADFHNYTEEIVRERPELAQLDAQKRAAQEEARVARGDRLPQLTYNLNGGVDAGDFRPLGRYAGGQMSVTLNVPVFDFGAAKSRQKQAELRAQQLDVQRENTVRQLRQEFYTSRAAALSALVRIKETEAGTQAAQQNVTLILARYRQKQATITEVVDAQAAYAEARAAYFQAIVDYHTARIRLETNPGR